MLKYAVMVFAGACCYGVLSTIVKFAYEQGFSNQEVVGSQMLVGAVATWLIVVLLRGFRSGVVPALKLMAVGTTVGMTSVLYYTALQHVTASLAIVLLFQFTWIGVLIESVWSRRLPRFGEWVSLPILVIGTVLASGLGMEGIGEWHWLGIVCGLGASVSYSLFIICSGRVAVETGGLTRSAWINTGALLLAFIVFPPTFAWNGALLDGLWLWGILLGVLGILLPTLLFAYGIPHIGGTLASILSSVELPTAVLLSYAILREHVGPLQWLGVTVILLGIAVSNMKRANGKHDNLKRAPRGG